MTFAQKLSNDIILILVNFAENGLISSLIFVLIHKIRNSNISYPILVYKSSHILFILSHLHWRASAARSTDSS